MVQRLLNLVSQHCCTYVSAKSVTAALWNKSHLEGHSAQKSHFRSIPKVTDIPWSRVNASFCAAVTWASVHIQWANMRAKHVEVKTQFAGRVPRSQRTDKTRSKASLVTPLTWIRCFSIQIISWKQKRCSKWWRVQKQLLINGVGEPLRFCQISEKCAGILRSVSFNS